MAIFIAKGVYQDIVTVLSFILGIYSFLKLSVDDLKELIPTIGNRIVVRKDVSKVRGYIFTSLA